VLILFFSALVIVLVGSILGALFARHLTAPLDQLTSAARNIGRGDFSSPIFVPDEPYEIATLASAFEESRVNTQQYMDDLTRAKAWSETVIQSIEEGIVTFDDQTIITSFSHGAQKITGWSSEEVRGKPLNEIFRLPEDEGVFSELIPPTGGKSQIEVLTRTGRKTSFAVTVAQLVPASGENSQTALVLRDVTEEEATQSLRSYFLANISHEFRTPLSALNASVELMLDELDDLSKAEINELLNSIHRSVTGLQTLIDNLLESIRIQAGRYQIHRQTIEFGDVVFDAVGVMKPLLDRRRQSLTLSEPEYYPVAMADPTRMTQVLVNLLSNASKYSPMETTIDLIVDQPDEHTLRVSVADRGLGISPTEREDIFRRFVRLSDQDGAQYGVGLGLSVVKAIVEEHGGEVGVKDHPGGGSIFWFTIPIDGDTA
jgi:PAS domain S-box-containing protein